MKKHLLLILLFIFSFQLFALNEQKYTFHTLSPQGGFYYDGVKKIVQDKEGFIWVMMDYDLFRFDGYEYKRYYTAFPEWEKSAYWIFNSMVVDDNNNFYVATNDGLYIYSKETDTFIQLYSETTSVIDKDARGNIWVKQNDQFGIFDSENKTITFPLYNGKIETTLRHLLPTESKELLFLSNYGKLYRYDYDKKEIILNQTQSTDIEAIGWVTDAQIDKGKLWVIIGNVGLLKVDLATLKIEESYNQYMTENNHARKLHIDKNGSVWVATLKGIYILDKKTKQFSFFEHQQNDKSSLPNSSIWTISEDWNGNIWLGTYAGGLCYVNINHTFPFKSYTSQSNQLNYLTVSSFADNDRYIWIGTEGGGVNRFDKRTEKFYYYTHDKTRNSISHNNVKSLILDAHENLWIGTYSGGLNCLNTHTGTFTTYTRDPNNKETSLSSNSIRKLIQEGNKGLWIAYQEYNTRVSFFSYQDHSIKHFNLCKEDSNQYIFDILRDRNNNLWALTRQKLIKMNINTHEVEEIVLENDIAINGQTFCLDLSGNLWIGTVGKGLIEYNPENSTFTVHDDIINHNTSSIYSIYYDSDAQLWIGTDNGLFKYDIANKKYLRFDENDGALGLMYYPLSVHKGQDDRIFFGGTTGFTIIDKNKVQINNTEAKVFITDFLVDNKPTKSIEKYKGEDGQITLNHEETNFGFKFSSDSYLMPNKNRFRYRLRGYDNDWIEIDASNRYAAYSKVPPGKYEFEVIAANNDGAWSTTPTTITIIRKPAIWASWPAYIIYFLASLGIILLIYHYYTEKKQLKLQLYLDSIEKSKREELHQSQLRFFTNISHDFRTPLSLIIGVVDRLRNEGLKEYYYRILNGNSQRLLNLVNELMDFRAVENDKMRLEVENTSLNELVNEVSSTFIDYAKQKNITYEIMTDQNIAPSLYIDKYIMEKVLMNLLNNAFKYTKEKGQIIVETYSSHNDFKPEYQNSYTVEPEIKYDHYFSIVVKDTGVGISKESISKVFERFYKVQTVNFDSHLGTGIGLALVKSLTLLHKGFITIHSERDKGTEIEVCFPSDKSIYTDSEVKVTDKNDCTNKNIEEEEQESTYTLPDSETEGLIKSSRYKILLAEDNHDLRKVIKEALSDTYDILDAKDGVEASELLDDNEIDLILSDIMMPRKDGIALCSEVKNNIETSHIPFIMLSAKTNVESKIEGVDSGADIYFEKPLDFNLLRSSIENIFKQREILREHYAKNHYVESSELSANEKDNEFLKEFIHIIEKNIDKSDLDVNFIASEMLMSRSKLYKKIKGITGKSIVEFILNYRLRKAARLIIEQDMTMREVMMQIGIESQPYFTNAFKKEFGKTPTQFAAEYKK